MARSRPVHLVIWQLAALAGQVAAVSFARRGQGGLAELLSDISLAVAFGSALWYLTSPQLSRAMRNTAVVCLGLTPTLMWRATNPLLFTGFDEQLHMRTLGDIISSHRLFQPNPLLEVSPRYPGLEAVTVLVHQLGVPTMAAAVVVILTARLVLVTVLCDAVEQITGSARAGGLAVAVYAVSPQFVFFNSQFAYQTLALPLALASVSLIARARKADDPLPFFGGATVCLLGMAITHHVTSFLTAAFLLAWAVAEKGHARWRIAYGALTAIAATLAWALVQRSLLTDYFGPIIDDVAAQFRGGARRGAFKDSAGTESAPLDKFLLLYYAAALSLTVAALTLLALRWWRRRDGRLEQSGPHFFLLMLTVCIPLALAARVVPKGGELFDRSSSFLFLPFCIVLADYAVHLWWRRDEDLDEDVSPQEWRATPAVRVLAVVFGAGIFLGGYVLGSGPNWARLPGPYMAAADTRSMDAETLAAVKWARGALPAGSRIGADRVSSTLLASQAGLWPVMKGASYVDVPALYVATGWNQAETDMASSMAVRYLYVDQRLAAELPPYGEYFFKGETGMGEQLTDAQLTKFDGVPGIELVYQHGPVSIYDLKGLGIPEQRNGWYESTPFISVADQLAVGLICGLFIALIMRSRIWPRVRDSATMLRRVWGPALTAATVLAAAGLVSVTMLLLQVWLTPLTVVSASLAVLLPHFAFAAFSRRSVSKVPSRQVRTAALLAVPLALIVSLAVLNAANETVTKVGQILEDPTATHVPSSSSR
ncbi:hypothetical protein A5650_25165 [Mycobacterium sp. 1164985.4]|nr:hypothetical protein A5650_25165 [Mycobacterium sp. 1164985.4]